MTRWHPFLAPVFLLAAVVIACSSNTPAPSPTATPPSSTATATGDPSLPRLGNYTGAAYTTKAPDFDPLPGAKADFGKLGKTVYRIEIPTSWNGDLVMWAHGYAGDSTVLSVDSPPQALRQQFISQGYAWAASSYSENGYDPGIGADDTLALKQFFVNKYGTPAHTYLVGESMGGNVTTLSLEHFTGQYDGALSMCGAVAGEEEIDYLTSWAMVAEYIGGVNIPLGQGAQAVTQALLNGMQKALGTPSNLTPAGQRFENVIQNLTGGPRPFFSEGFASSYLVDFGVIIADPNRTSLPGAASTNVGVTYHIDPSFGLTDATLNAGVRRLAADPTARDVNVHPDSAPTTGNISVPLLTLHGTGDLFVPITLEQSYLKKVQAAGKSNLLVQRAIRSAGHCQFSGQEETTAWTDLVNWVTNGTKPAGDDLSGSLSNIGLQFTTPLRSGDPGNK
jgi:pimeloyl-ACP methyl ester carboxylesterase